MEPFLGIHAVNVYVRDQDASLRFYVDQLGFTLAFDGRLQSGDRWIAVSPPDGTAVLSLVAPPPDSKDYERIGRPTGVVLVTEDVLGTYAKWRKRGVRFSFSPRLRRVTFGIAEEAAEGSPVWGGTFTQFRDPDGNSFVLAGFDEVNRRIEARRRRIAETQEAERRAAQEIAIAKQVQARLLPHKRPSMETLVYAASCIQARQVGGDYHDVLDLGRGRYGLVIADVSGKGIAAALLMANLQASLRSQCAIASDDPGRLLRSVNQLFYENSDECSYATLLFAEYDDRTRRVRYVNCGHLPALLLRADGAIDRLESTTTVVGLFESWDCSIGEQQLFPGDTLALYTDGISESLNDAGEDFGECRLVEALRRSGGLAPDTLISSIVDEVRRFSPEEQQDDITLVVAQCREDDIGRQGATVAHNRRTIR